MIGQIFDFTWGWIIAGTVLIGLEILIPGAFLVWIGIGAVLTGVILSLFPDLPFAWQSLAFAATMLASVGLGFVLQRRGRDDDAARHLNRELAAMVGQRYRALTDFEAGRGRIQVGDSSYSAIGEAPIAAGEIVEVVDIEDGRPRVARPPGV